MPPTNEVIENEVINVPIEGVRHGDVQIEEDYGGEYNPDKDAIEYSGKNNEQPNKIIDNEETYIEGVEGGEAQPEEPEEKTKERKHKSEKAPDDKTKGSDKETEKKKSDGKYNPDKDAIEYSGKNTEQPNTCLLYTSPSPRDS